MVRIPADLDRPDRILVGLTARQLAILAAGGVAAWTLAGLLEPLVGLPAAAVLAAPVALAAMALALGWRDGLPLDRLAVAGLGWWRQPSRLVVAPDGIPPAPAWAGPARPAGWRRSTARSVAWIPPGWWIWAGRGGRWCVWPPRSTSACGPRPSSRPLLASFARLLHALAGPMQVLVRSDRADLTPLATHTAGAGRGPAASWRWSRRRWPTPAGWRP